MTKISCTFVNCHKKLNIVESIKGTCRCNQIYCSEHMANHSCKFDYKAFEKEKLIKNKPQIVSNKFERI